jgi:hypothetical protein
MYPGHVRMKKHGTGTNDDGHAITGAFVLNFVLGLSFA